MRIRLSHAQTICEDRWSLTAAAAQRVLRPSPAVTSGRSRTRSPSLQDTIRPFLPDGRIDADTDSPDEPPPFALDAIVTPSAWHIFRSALLIAGVKIAVAAFGTMRTIRMIERASGDRASERGAERFVSY